MKALVLLVLAVPAFAADQRFATIDVTSASDRVAGGSVGRTIMVQCDGPVNIRAGASDVVATFDDFYLDTHQAYEFYLAQGETHVAVIPNPAAAVGCSLFAVRRPLK